MKLLRTQPEIIEAYRARIRELNITYATVDAISGLPEGYTAKLMSPKPMKRLGEKAIEGLNGALGIAFVVTIDGEQVGRVQGRWAKRRRAIDKKKQALLVSALSIDNEVPQVLQISANLDAEMRKKRMQELGSLGGKKGGSNGGKKRAKNMKKRARQRAASHAARARWAKKALPEYA